MNTKHTPGPWYSKEFGIRGEDGPSQFRICQELPNPRKVIADTYGYSEEDSANALLIKAAPDLLEALQAVTRALEYANRVTNQDYGKDCLPVAHAAIDKALGQPNALSVGGAE